MDCWLKICGALLLAIMWCNALHMHDFSLQAVQEHKALKFQHVLNYSIMQIQETQP